MPRRHRLRAAVLAMGTVSTTMAGAGSFAVSPVRVTLAAGRNTGALTVHNKSSEPTVVQLEVLDWSQRDGEDVLVPTREVLATPPIFTLAADGSQVIRIGLRGRAPAPQRELSYRLLIKEVVPDAAAGSSGVQVALHISLPVFVMPVAASAPSLRWQARGGDALELSAFNDGNTHLQLAGVRLGGPDGTAHRVTGYLLPGQGRAWRLPYEPPVGSPLRVLARTDAGDIAADVVVTRP